MKKKYSDPLMYPATLLTIPIDPSPIGHPTDPDEPWDEEDGNNINGAKFMLNAAPAQTSAEPLTIVNPVEEAVTEPAAAAAAEEGAPAATLSEVEPVIDSIVPDETVSSDVTE